MQKIEIDYQQRLTVDLRIILEVAIVIENSSVKKPAEQSQIFYYF